MQRSLAGFFFTPFTATFGAMAVANLGLFLTDYAASTLHLVNLALQQHLQHFLSSLQELLMW